MPIFRQLPAYDASVINTLVPEQFDSISAAYPSGTQEVYTYSFKSVTVATVTVTYTDATKANVSTVVRT